MARPYEDYSLFELINRNETKKPRRITKIVDINLNNEKLVEAKKEESDTNTPKKKESVTKILGGLV